MLVFRDGRRVVAARTLFDQAAASCERLNACPTPDTLLDALLCAGELECALADARSAAAGTAELLTDALSDALVGGNLRTEGLRLVQRLRAAEFPGEVRVSVPEGFAYYALHPLDYAAAARRLPRAHEHAVVGIRSIGTTLSAVVAAALRERGARAARLTGRPSGHPWDRRLQWTEAQAQWVEAARQRGAEFVVVDEGPGLSGSSFLSLGEALLRAGVARERITFLCAHLPDPAKLCARDAAERWRGFRALAAGATERIPRDAGADLSGGLWRALLLPDGAEWPESWTAFERRKYLSADGCKLYKFEGLGRYGAAVYERAQRLHELGFAPAVAPAGDGFYAYERLGGSMPARAGDYALRRLAEYCVARTREFGVAGVDVRPLAELAAVNHREEFSEEAPPLELALERPVVPDGRMQPHEWVETPEGVLLKTDGAGHGDDHFFPGPTDIAWDLAGAIVEWRLDGEARARLLDHYRRASGDDAAARLPAWLLAYALFRLGYTRMAGDALRGSEEEPRLRRAAERYRAVLAESMAPAAS